ncbi:M20/M25/M40 family metallo-hydrolase [Microbacterium sp. CPCC 204701]|uniref:M20/M25/M40 family metallo-hydrolase n=1 Tax=Microbacterium sp. CPCC 204701 TaxID=2493084 RepID=UPI00197C1977|nr:M20/M25/M40 family metallo-hydrolase [Microbacterium sp. CPCC 204701]
MSAPVPFPPADTALSDVVRIARDLIRIDTSNYGSGRFEPESVAADYVEAVLAGLGIDATRYERTPGRTNLVARWRGADPSLPALMLHAHLDVVPADPAAWTYPPFAGVIVDGMLWGRGAVDMKNYAAMILAAVSRLVAEGFKPRSDIVLAFFADEEGGTEDGSDWLVDAHPEALAGVDTAIGEGGGYSVNVFGQRAYLMNTGEKGVLWLELSARGQSGHGSLPAVDNPILTLARAVSRIGEIEWPLVMTDTTATLLARLRELAGADPEVTPEQLALVVGPSASRIRAGLRNVSNVTIVAGGYKENVVPETATATVDLRFIPGCAAEAIAHVREVVGDDVEVRTLIELPAFEAPFAGRVINQLQQIIAEVDPGAIILPHLIPGGTDAKPLRRIGIDGYGFIPLLLPDDFAFPRMFHGVDERVPLEALDFGEEVLRRLLQRS